MSHQTYFHPPKEHKVLSFKQKNSSRDDKKEKRIKSPYWMRRLAVPTTHFVETICVTRSVQPFTKCGHQKISPTLSSHSAFILIYVLRLFCFFFRFLSFLLRLISRNDIGLRVVLNIRRSMGWIYCRSVIRLQIRCVSESRHWNYSSQFAIRKCFANFHYACILWTRTHNELIHVYVFLVGIAHCAPNPITTKKTR